MHKKFFAPFISVNTRDDIILYCFHNSNDVLIDVLLYRNLKTKRQSFVNISCKKDYMDCNVASRMILTNIAASLFRRI